MPAAVTKFSNVMRATSSEQLIARFDPVRMTQLNIYGGPWCEPGRDYIIQSLAPFGNSSSLLLRRSMRWW
jgi:hypothetical protein